MLPGLSFMKWREIALSVVHLTSTLVQSKPFEFDERYKKEWREFPYPLSKEDPAPLLCSYKTVTLDPFPVCSSVFSSARLSDIQL